VKKERHATAAAENNSNSVSQEALRSASLCGTPPSLPIVEKKKNLITFVGLSNYVPVYWPWITLGLYNVPLGAFSFQNLMGFKLRLIDICKKINFKLFF
jgi:hypothetical protein